MASLHSLGNKGPEIGFTQTTPSHHEKDSLNRRIMLVGRTGVGKSATGNTILEEKRFKSKLSSSSVTSECELQQAVVSGRNVSVIKTPCLFDTTMCHEMLGEVIVTSINLSSPGPHAFLYVQPINVRFTEQEENDFEKLEIIFGKEIKKYTIFLFTYADMLEGKTVDMVIQENRTLGRLVDQCGGGYHIFNNKDLGNRNQVSELLKKIDRMVEKNGGNCYSKQMYEEARGEMGNSVREKIQMFERKNEKKWEKSERPKREEQTRMRIEIPEKFRTEEKNKREESEGVKREEEEEEEKGNKGVQVREEVKTEHFLMQGEKEESEEAFKDSAKGVADGDEYRNPVLNTLTRMEIPEKFSTEEKIKREESEGVKREEEEKRGNKGVQVREEVKTEHFLMQGEKEESEEAFKDSASGVADGDEYRNPVLNTLTRMEIPEKFSTEEKIKREESEGVKREEEEKRGNKGVQVREEVKTEHFLMQGEKEESEEAFKDSASGVADGDEYRNPVLNTLTRMEIPEKFSTEEKIKREESEGVKREEEEKRGNKGVQAREEVKTEHFLMQGEKEESEEAFKDSASGVADGDEYRNPVLNTLTRMEIPEKFSTEEKIKREESEGVKREEEEKRGNKGVQVREEVKTEHFLMQGEKEESKEAFKDSASGVADGDEYRNPVLNTLTRMEIPEKFSTEEKIKREESEGVKREEEEKRGNKGVQVREEVKTEHFLMQGEKEESEEAFKDSASGVADGDEYRNPVLNTLTRMEIPEKFSTEEKIKREESEGVKREEEEEKGNKEVQVKGEVKTEHFLMQGEKEESEEAFKDSASGVADGDEYRNPVLNTLTRMEIPEKFRTEEKIKRKQSEGVKREEEEKRGNKGVQVREEVKTMQGRKKKSEDSASGVADGDDYGDKVLTVIVLSGVLIVLAVVLIARFKK